MTIGFVAYCIVYVLFGNVLLLDTCNAFLLASQKVVWMFRVRMTQTSEKSEKKKKKQDKNQ